MAEADREAVVRPHVLLTLGCHRSGTSVVARSLRCLGAELGADADWSGPDNVLGFFEDQDALAINDLILRKLGSGWDNPTPLNLSKESGAWINAPVISWLLDRRLKEMPLFGLKEPRLCRLLPIWRQAIDSMNPRPNVSVVFAVRHPMAVAQSLNKRNHLPIETGLALWLEYTKRARLDVDPTWESVWVRYDRLLANPHFEITRMAGKLYLSPAEAEIELFRHGFLDSSLQHEVEDETPLPPDVQEEWDNARKWAVA